MGGTGRDEYNQIVDRKTWLKLFRTCRCKQRYKKSNGSADIQCFLLAFPYFGRCYYRKCPKIKPNWGEEKESWIHHSVDGPTLLKNGYLDNPMDSIRKENDYSEQEKKQEA